MAGLGNVFLEKEFFLLIVFSIFIPVILYRLMWSKRTISRVMVFFFGLALILLAGIDVFLLRILADLAKHSSSILDDRVFNSEISVALYLLPALFAGTGINLVSHIFIKHLVEAEKRFDSEHG